MSRITVCNRTGDTSSVGTAYHYGVYCGSHNHAGDKRHNPFSDYTCN